MSGDMVQVYIADHGPLGPAAYPVQAVRGTHLLDGGIVMVGREQAERWASAEAEWETAQAEMRAFLETRARQKAAALASVTDFESAHRAISRSGGRKRHP